MDDAERQETSRVDFQLTWHAEHATAGSHSSSSSSSSSPRDPFASFACPGSDAQSSTAEPTPAPGAVSCNMLIEVKSVTLVKSDNEGQQKAGTSYFDGSEGEGSQRNRNNTNRIAEFPDSVSTRASRHLRCLIAHKAANPTLHRAAVFFLIQRDDCSAFQACHIDPEYTQGLEKAVAEGVEVIVYACSIDPVRGEVSLLPGAIPFQLNPLPAEALQKLEDARNRPRRKRKRAGPVVEVQV